MFGWLLCYQALFLRDSTSTVNPSHPSVLFINRVFPPVSGATGTLLAELSSDLAREGWDVTVLTGPGLDGRRLSELHGGVRVERVRGLRFPRAGHLQRAAAYLLLYPLFLWRALRLGRFDVVVTKTDPPMLLVLGTLVGFLTSARTVHWAQDLYPDIAEALSVIRPGGLLARELRALSNFALRKHDRVITVGACMAERVAARGIPRDRIAVVPNWPLDGIRPVCRTQNPFRASIGLNREFVVMYSGNMGRVHDFGPVLDAAEILEERCSTIRFVFVGDGPQKERIQENIRERGLQNVRIVPFQPAKRLSEGLSAADLHLVTMQENVCGLVVPSKIYGVMAAGRPLLFLGPRESEAALTVRAHACGDVLPSPTGVEVATAIIEWRADHDGRVSAGRRAHSAMRDARRDSIAAFQELLSATVGRHVVDTSALNLSKAHLRAASPPVDAVS